MAIANGVYISSTCVVVGALNRVALVFLSHGDLVILSYI